MSATTSTTWVGGAVERSRPSTSANFFSPLSSGQLSRPYHDLCKWRVTTRTPAKNGGRSGRASANATSPWDEKPYEVLPSGKKSYLDEQDVLTFLDPPKELIPLDPSSYNPASYLWKKIEDIPEERRHRLLSLVSPRHISRAWETAGTRYDCAKLAKKSASSLLANEDGTCSFELWNCRTSGGPFPISWIKNFQKAIFSFRDGNVYGRLRVNGSLLAGIANSNYRLYFTVRQVTEVMSTEQPCDEAYELGDGLLNLPEYPQGFPKPAKHPWPFNDEVIIYIRHLGPGVLVGQAWREGVAMQQVPKKLCGEILMVKNYSVMRETN